MLVNPDNDDTPTHKISFEETYSAVYKCVCEHKAEQLYNDLIEHISGIVQSWKGSLDRMANDPGSLVKGVDDFSMRFSSKPTTISSSPPGRKTSSKSCQSPAPNPS